MFMSHEKLSSVSSDTSKQKDIKISNKREITVCSQSTNISYLGSCLVPETVKGLTVEKGANESRSLDARDWLPLGKMGNKETRELQVTTGAVGKIKQVPLKGWQLPRGGTARLGKPLWGGCLRVQALVMDGTLKDDMNLSLRITKRKSPTRAKKERMINKTTR